MRPSYSPPRTGPGAGPTLWANGTRIRQVRAAAHPPGCGAPRRKAEGMPLPPPRLSTAPPADIEADVLVLGATKNGSGVTMPELPGLDDLAELIEGIGVTGARDQVVRIPGTGVSAGSIAIVGLGGEATPEALRYAAGAVTRQVRGVQSI